MFKVLAPVDGSSTPHHAAQYLVRLAKGCGAIEVHLLNAREPIDAWEVRHFLRDQEIGAMQSERGEDAKGSVRALLDQAGVRHMPHTLVGPVAETIVRFVKEQGCDQIGMGTRGLGAVENLFPSSIATKAIHLTDVPVTLVK